jgi:pimeloyl-ACP methyl ester carboxylesterase
MRFWRRGSIRFLAVVLFAVAAAGGSAAHAQTPSPAGTWYGPLSVGPMELRLGVVITAGPDGTLTGVLDSLDQGAKDVPMDAVTLKDRAFAFTIKPLGIAFDGTLSADGQSIKGEFRQGGAVIPYTLKRTPERVESRRPQHPVPPYPYVEEEVSYQNGPIRLAGTLTKPQGAGPFPVVLLITGSGAQDRDETILGHKLFLVLADHLTRKGIAVLRMDDRGVGGSTGVLTDAGIEDLASDVLTGVGYLRSRKDVRADRIGLIGHSEGGMVAPLVASRTKDVAFMVLLAAPGLTGEEVLLEQIGLVLKAEREVPDAEVAKARERQARALAILKDNTDDATARKRLDALEAEELAKLTEAEKQEYASFKAQAAAQMQTIVTPWFRSFVRYDPRVALLRVSCPVLALNGATDVQVAAKANLSAIARALQDGGNTDVTVKELPGLNHLFQHSATGAIGEYGRIEETFAPQALDEISRWIIARTR